MRKSFAALKMTSLAGAFGHCRTDEDKVKLLSVLSNTSFNCDDDDTSSTASGGDIVSSTSSTEDNHNHRRRRRDQRRTPTIEINDCCVVDDDVLSRSVNLITQENVVERTKNDDDVDKRPETVKRDVDDYSPSAADVKQNKNEWTFTLYDFDAKGKVTKEDILSLVRSIYEVLAKAKIPIIRGCHDSTTGRPIGAFKVKLSVINDDVEGSADAKNNCGINKKKSSTVNNYHKKSTTTANHKTTSTKYQSTSSLVDEMNNDGDIVDDDDVFATTSINNNYSSFDVDRFYEEIPLIRRQAKKALKRQHDNGKQSTSPIPYGKLHRHSGGVEFLEQQPSVDVSSPTTIGSPPRKHCTNCTYRDYVNLSEVENCCSNHNHHQSSPTTTTCAANKSCVHHIRHCDRHCHCPPTMATTTSSSKLMNFVATDAADPCLTSLENEYEKNLHKKLICCGGIIKNNNRTSLETVINLHNQQNNHNHYHGLPLNERARAYYSQQRASSAKQTKNRTDAAALDYVELKDFAPLTKDSRLEPSAKISLHQKKHRNREKDKIRAMEQVREWILNDVVVTTNDDDEENVGPDKKFSTKKISTEEECRDVVDDGITKIINDVRGEADGCNRYLVEHKHVHEHHHFHHF